MPGRPLECVTSSSRPDYAVPDALGLLHVDREADLAVYREENLWMEHDPTRIE